MTAIRRTLSALSQYPSAIVGLAIIIAMVLFSIYTTLRHPLKQVFSFCTE